MEKKMSVMLFFFAGVFAIGYYFINVNDKNKEKENSNSNSNTEVEKITDVKQVNLYITDFKYDEQANGYIYEEMPLTDEQITNIKKIFSDVDLSSVNGKTIYGKYKLVIDNRIIFFDPNSEYGLYKNKNYTISLPKELVNKLTIQNQKLCSCCTTSNCNINLCSCNK